jgi:hypothetical protein
MTSIRMETLIYVAARIRVLKKHFISKHWFEHSYYLLFIWKRHMIDLGIATEDNNVGISLLD